MGRRIFASGRGCSSGMWAGWQGSFRRGLGGPDVVPGPATAVHHDHRHHRPAGPDRPGCRAGAVRTGPCHRLQPSRPWSGSSRSGWPPWSGRSPAPIPGARPPPWVSGPSHAAQLRALGRFTDDAPRSAGGLVGGVDRHRPRPCRPAGSPRRLPQPLQRELVGLVVPHLPGLDIRATRQLVAVVADQLQPGDPDLDELSEHKARHLTWTRHPPWRGGVPGVPARPRMPRSCGPRSAPWPSSCGREGDGVTPRQRHADALMALVERARTNQPSQRRGPARGPDPDRLVDRGGTDRRPRPRRVRHLAPGQALWGWAAQPANRSGTPRSGSGCAAPASPPSSTTQPTPASHRRQRRRPGHRRCAGSLLGRIARTGIEPLAVGRAVRLATPAQRKALQARDGGCVIPGCSIPAGLHRAAPRHRLGHRRENRSGESGQLLLRPPPADRTRPLHLHQTTARPTRNPKAPTNTSTGGSPPPTPEPNPSPAPGGTSRRAVRHAVSRPE